MVEITKGYIFQVKGGEASLYDLFGGYKQLIVHHFMFDPSWKEGYDICSMMVDNMGHSSHLEARNTRLSDLKSTIRKIKAVSSPDGMGNSMVFFLFH